MIRKLITIIALLGLWQVASLSIGKEVILPLPFDVFSYMFELLKKSTFYLAVISTLFRVFFSFSLAFIIGITLGIFSGLNKHIEEYLATIIALLQTIPQIAYILILLVWFKSFTAIVVIVLLMILPVFYNNTLNGIKHIDSELKDVILLYHQPLIYTIPKVYLPLIKGYILSAIDSCLPLSLKIGVMAEIFVQTNTGIGEQLFLSRVQIDMIGIFAWTLWMVIIIALILNIFRFIKNKYLMT